MQGPKPSNGWAVAKNCSKLAPDRRWSLQAVPWEWQSCHRPATGRGQELPRPSLTAQVSSETQRRRKRGPSLASQASRSSLPERSKRRRWEWHSGSTPRRTLRQPATSHGRSLERRPSGSGASRDRSASHSPASTPGSMSEERRSALQSACSAGVASGRSALAGWGLTEVPRPGKGRGRPPLPACPPSGHAGTHRSRQHLRAPKAPSPKRGLW